jgi:uroporphyrinogen-III synthase
MKILVTRPIEQTNELAKKIIELGHEPIISPLIKITQLNNLNLDILEDFDAIIITSRNALLSILNANKNSKLIIVGKQTTQYAQSLGFSNANFAGHDIAELKQNLNKTDKLLYLSGSEITDNLEDFPNITRQITYTSETIEELPGNFFEFFKLKELRICILFSLRTAKNLIYLVNKHNLNCSNIIILTLSQNIAELFKNKGFHACYVAKKPELEYLISLIEKI